MDDDWNLGAGPGGETHPYEGGRIENVVPADGDPAVPYYRARHQAERGARPRTRIYLFGGAPAARRGSRRWLWAVGLIALVLLLIKPLVLLTTVLAALLVGLVVVGVLAVGALWLAFRLVLGTHATYPPARWRGGPRRG
jgi:hypothetical protein